MHEAAFSIEGGVMSVPTQISDIILHLTPETKRSYGSQWLSSYRILLKRNGWEPRLSMLFVCTPRQVGKSTFLGYGFSLQTTIFVGDVCDAD
jgi:hypothetical protein